jgi:hypothetical protein
MRLPVALLETPEVVLFIRSTEVYIAQMFVAVSEYKDAACEDIATWKEADSYQCCCGEQSRL